MQGGTTTTIPIVVVLFQQDDTVIAIVAKMPLVPVEAANRVAFALFVEFLANPTGHKPVLPPATNVVATFMTATFDIFIVVVVVVVVAIDSIRVQQQEIAPRIKLRQAPYQVSILVDTVFASVLAGHVGLVVTPESRIVDQLFQ